MAVQPAATAGRKVGAWRRGADWPCPTYAAVDLGTNNCRLLVARPNHAGFKVVDAFSRIVRLGEGVSVTGRLAPRAMDRTLAALKVCASKMRRRGVVNSRAVATEACRQACNFGDFHDRVLDQTGLELEVISSAEEARLAMTGCAPLLDPAVDHALVFDIGGGSTELMWLKADTVDGLSLIDCISLPIGVVTLSERYGGDCVPVHVYESMVATVIDALASFEAANGIRDRIATGTVQMLGSSGTVTTLAGVFRELPRYDRAVVDGSFLDFSSAYRVSRKLLSMGFAERATHPCIGRDRADLVVAGCAVLEAICHMWPVGRLRIADRGVREGILFELMAGHPLARRAALPR